MMFRKQWALALSLTGALVLAGCGGAAQPTVQPQQTAVPVAEATGATALSPLPTPGVAASPLVPAGATAASRSELVTALESAGATVETGDKIEQPFFEVQGEALKVNGQSVEVFEWVDEASRAAVSATITPEGQFGTTMVEWVGTPHFWASGKMIVLYVGDNSEVVNLLTGALGAPITQR